MIFTSENLSHQHLQDERGKTRLGLNSAPKKGRDQDCLGSNSPTFSPQQPDLGQEFNSNLDLGQRLTSVVGFHYQERRLVNVFSHIETQHLSQISRLIHGSLSPQRHVPRRRRGMRGRRDKINDLIRQDHRPISQASAVES